MYVCTHGMDGAHCTFPDIMYVVVTYYVHNILLIFFFCAQTHSSYDRVNSGWVCAVALSEKSRTPPPQAVGKGRVVRVGLGWVRSGQVGSGWVRSGQVGSV